MPKGPESGPGPDPEEGEAGPKLGVDLDRLAEEKTEKIKTLLSQPLNEKRSNANIETYPIHYPNLSDEQKENLLAKIAEKMDLDEGSKKEEERDFGKIRGFEKGGREILTRTKDRKFVRIEWFKKLEKTGESVKTREFYVRNIPEYDWNKDENRNVA